MRFQGRYRVPEIPNVCILYANNSQIYAFIPNFFSKIHPRRPYWLLSYFHLDVSQTLLNKQEHSWPNHLSPSNLLLQLCPYLINKNEIHPVLTSQNLSHLQALPSLTITFKSCHVLFILFIHCLCDSSPSWHLHCQTWHRPPSCSTRMTATSCPLVFSSRFACSSFCEL